MRDTQFLSEDTFARAELAEDVKLAQRNADFVEWLAGQSESFQALASEWFTLQDERKMPIGFTPTIFRDRRGRLLYEVSCPNGVHQSHESFEHALEFLVDSFRTRFEDLASTHERFLAFRGDGNIKGARRACMDMAKKVREANPGLTGEEYDVLMEEELERREAEHAFQIEDAKVFRPRL